MALSSFSLRALNPTAKFDSIADNKGNVIGTSIGGTLIGSNFELHIHQVTPKPIERRFSYIKTQAQILSWLCDQDVTDRLTTVANDRVAKKPHPDAGKRFLGSREFESWLELKEKRLWCFAPPGAGKTFTVSRVQNHMKQLSEKFSQAGGKAGVAFLYLNSQFRYTESELLGCIARQLLTDTDEIPKKVKQMWANYTSDTNDMEDNNKAVIAVPGLVDLLKSLTQGRKVYIVVDALDECLACARKPLITALTSLSSEVGLLITSRYMAEFDDLFVGFHPLNISTNKRDAQEYIRHYIRKTQRLKDFCKQDRNLESDICHAVLGNSQNNTDKSQIMFLLVRLHMETLEAAKLSRHVRDELETLRSTVDDKYDDMLRRIEQQGAFERNLAFQAISWVAYAARPLRVVELQHILAVSVKDTAFDPSRIPRIDDIVGYCSNIIVVDSSSETIQLVHPTAATYMHRIRESDDRFKDFHVKSALICGTYISFPILEEPDDPERGISYATDLYDDDRSYKRRDLFELLKQSQVRRNGEEPTERLSFWTKLRAYSFAEYAGVYFGHHLRLMESQTSEEATMAIHLASKMLSERPKRNFYSRILYEADMYPPPLGEQFREYGTRSDSQILSLCYEDTEEDENDDDPDDAEAQEKQASPAIVHAKQTAPVPAPEITPLHLAAHMQYPQLVQPFLHEKSMVQTKDPYGLTPLDVALQGGNMLVAKPLLEAGANLNIGSRLGCRLLLLVAQSCNDGEVISNVLDQAIGFRNPTWLATYTTSFRVWLSSRIKAFMEVARRLIPQLNRKERCEDGYSAERNVANEKGDGGLQHVVRRNLVCEGGCKEVDLLKLVWAANRGDCAAISSLVAGRRVTLSGTIGSRFHHLVQAAFFLAVERHHLSVIELLLEHGVDVDIRDFSHRTGLHRAVTRKRTEMVKFLINQGANIEAKDSWRYTPWVLAASQQSDEISDILKAHGANVNRTGTDGVHLLYGAAAGGHLNDVRYLLKQNVNPSILTDFRWAPLHWAANNGHLEVVRELIDAGADVNPVSDQFKSPLDMAVEQGQTEVEEVLRVAGAKTAAEILEVKAGKPFWLQGGDGEEEDEESRSWGSSYEEYEDDEDGDGEEYDDSEEEGGEEDGDEENGDDEDGDEEDEDDKADEHGEENEDGEEKGKENESAGLSRDNFGSSQGNDRATEEPVAQGDDQKYLIDDSRGNDKVSTHNAKAALNDNEKREISGLGEGYIESND